MLVPRKHPSHHGKPKATQLLIAIGMNKNRFTPQASRSNAVVKSYQLRKQNKSSAFSLWNHNDWELLDLLHEARGIYLKKIKRLHPDMPGGSHAQAVSLNLAWDGVVRMFSKRGITLN